MAVVDRPSLLRNDWDRSAIDPHIIATFNADNYIRQVGQLFMVSFDGTTVNDQIKSLIEDYHVGSVLLTAQNLKCAYNTNDHSWHMVC